MPCCRRSTPGTSPAEPAELPANPQGRAARVFLDLPATIETAPTPEIAAVSGDQPPKRPRLWLRFLLAALLIVSSSAVATSVSILDYLGGIAAALAHNGRLSAVDRFLAHGYNGGPQTLLLIGSDHRPDNSTSAHGLSDTVLLVRLDPGQSTINMLSIPRDLKVEIPGHGIGKFNSAYSYGGPELTLRTLKQLTGLSVNHLFVIDFKGFAKAVDAIGCVYIDVDRRYYHSNEGLAPSEDYSEINIQPGYQKLCGTDALEYVRYRHTDSDLVREARQQAFLRDARQMIPASQLVAQRNQLIEIFTRYTTSDLHSTEELLDLLKLFVELKGAAVKQVSFPAELHPVVENQPNYVTAEPAAIQRTVTQFLGTGPALRHGAAQRPGQHGHGSRRRGAAHRRLIQSHGSVGLVDASGLGAEEAAKTHGSSRFPVFYPAQLPAGSSWAEAPRSYHIEDEAGKRHSAYAMVMELPTGAYTAYFGVQGIAGWQNPPILSGTSEPISIGGRRFQAFTNGGHIRMIAWHQGGNVYWIYNTLAGVLSNGQMLGVARSLRERR